MNTKELGQLIAYIISTGVEKLPLDVIAKLSHGNHCRNRTRRVKISMKRECDCEQCILGWEERGLEDCDAGCYYYPDLGWNGLMCHAPKFIKKIIHNRKMRQRDKYYEEWDDYGEFMKEQDRKENAMIDAIQEVLLQDGNMICYTGHDGKLHPYSSSYLYQHAWEVASKYEELLNRKESEKE